MNRTLEEVKEPKVTLPNIIPADDAEFVILPAKKLFWKVISELALNCIHPMKPAAFNPLEDSVTLALLYTFMKLTSAFGQTTYFCFCKILKEICKKAFKKKNKIQKTSCNSTCR